MDRLTKDGIYVRIGNHSRELRQGGKFEIYKSHSKDPSKMCDRVNDVIQNENFSFINANRLEQDLHTSILQRKTLPDTEFNEQKYLIREKNTLRLSNPSECAAIDEALLVTGMKGAKLEAASSDTASDQLPLELVKDIMQHSYGRMAMANQRARDRYDTLVAIYNKIFSFELKKQKVHITIYNGRNNNETNFTSIDSDDIYYVTVKDGDSQKYLLKKVLETLQVYNSSNINSHLDDNHNFINGTIPLLIKLNIGGEMTEFMLSQWPVSDINCRTSQLLVSTSSQSSDSFQGNTYTYWCGNKGGFSSQIEDWQKQLATALLNCLNAPVDKQPNVLKSYTKFIPNIVQFLVTTQTAEACHGRNKTYARTMGMNKLARKLLLNIADGNSTFECFTLDEHNDIRSNGYPPVGTGGTKIAREVVCKVTKKGAACYAMSDDSD